MLSVATNVGQMIALQMLRDNQQNLSQIEDRLATGLAVASPKDNGAAFAISQNMRGLVKSYDALMEANDRTLGLLDVTVAASQSISDTLIDMRALALAATDPSLSSADRSAINEQFLALKGQIDSIAGSATYNGKNLIDSSGSNFVRYGSGAVPAGTNMAEWGATPRTVGEPLPGDPLTLRFGFDGSGQQSEQVGGTIDFNLRYFDQGSWNVVSLGSTSVPTTPPPKVGPGEAPYTAELNTTMPVLPDTATDVQIYAEYQGKLPDPDGKSIWDISANGDPSPFSGARDVPHLLMQWREGDWTPVHNFVPGGIAFSSVSGNTEPQVSSGGSTTAGSVQGHAVLYPDSGVTQAGVDYTPSYQVFDASQGSWVTLATGASQSIPVSPVSGPIDLAYNIAVPTPPDDNADFTKARIVLNMTVYHDSQTTPVTAYSAAPTVAQADNTAATFPSTRQVESITKVDALGGIDGRNVPLRQKNSESSSVAGLALQSAALSNQGAATQALNLIDNAQKRVLAQTQYYASQSKAFSIANNFESKLVDTLNAGIGRLVDADMTKEAAKLTAAQTQQQLAVQTLAMSNAYPNLMLSLFSTH